MGTTSRTTGDCHIRFCEGLEVKRLRPTRRLKKNHEWLCAAFALVNIYQYRRRLAKVNLQMAPQGA